MKKNYVKLEIKNNKIILKEEGTKYGQLGVSAASNLGKMAVDALKMVKTTIQRAWGATFLYGYNIITAMFQDGIKGLHSANQQFHRDDSALKREQMQLIASQPGNKDAKLFLGMTCPAALAFDKYVDSDLSKFRDAAIKTTRDAKDIKDKKFGKPQDTYEARVAYTNLVSVISHLSDNTPLDLIEVKYDRDDDKIPILKAVKKNIDKDRFRSMSKYLQKFYKSKKPEDIEDEDESKKDEDEDTFYISSDMKEVLEMIYKKSSDKKVIAHITKKRLSSIVKKKTKSFVNNKVRKAKIKTEFEDFLKDNILESFNATLYIKNKKLVLEDSSDLPLYYTEGDEVEKPDVDKTSRSTAKKVDAKTAMMLSFSEYYLIGIDTLTLLIEIQMQKNSTMILSNEKLLSTLSKKEDFDSNTESLINKKVQEISVLTDSFNKRVSQLEKFKVKLEKSSVADIKDFAENFSKSIEMIKESYNDIKDEKDDVKDLTYSQVMLDIIKKIKPEIKNINPDLFKDSFTDAMSTINEFFKEIEENYKKTCEKNSDKLAKNKISYKEIINKKESFTNKMSQMTKDLSDSYKNIENFTQKESELESFIKEKKDEIESESGDNKEDTEENSKDDKANFSKSDSIKSEIVKVLEK